MNEAIRRKGGLGKDAERAENRAKQLTAIDPDWNCPWPLDWQRHHRVLADLVDADGTLPDIPPGVLFEGDDLGKWLAQQRKPHTWAQLTGEQQERLTGLGIQPAQRPAPTPAAKSGGKTSGKASAAFQRGVQALAQYIAREGTHVVARSHLERIVIEDQEHELKLGVWYANQKQRRDKLTEPQRAALTELGVEWA
ncbi:helicase associated domain-containing protein [Streptomyces sp. NBC_01578]|uniref:helicase associated domain-containing protein n=1 Tax=unclassified Streptomyces TaxID=2593676 RepID=UPI00386F0B71